MEHAAGPHPVHSHPVHSQSVHSVWLSGQDADQATGPHRRYVLQVDVPGGIEPAVHAQVDAVLARVAHDLQSSIPASSSSVERLGAVAATLDQADPRRHGLPLLEVDVEARRVFVGERLVQLAFKEFEILRLLVRRPGEVVTREEIAAGIGEAGEPPAPRTIDVHVHRIRAKLEATGDCISTVRGLGYRFNPSASVVVV